MHTFQAIRILALRQVVKEDDSEYLLRKVFRWYSKTFYTPLHVVEELPMDHVLQAYWESQYEEMEGSKLEEEMRALFKTEEQRKKEDRAWDEQQAEELEFAKFAGEVDLGKKDGKLKDLKPQPAKPLVPANVTTQSSIEKVGAALEAFSETLNGIKELPPDVHMVFGEVPVEDDMDGPDSFSAPVKPK